jgi:hypothetical protein
MMLNEKRKETAAREIYKPSDMLKAWFLWVKENIILRNSKTKQTVAGRNNAKQG